MGCWSPINAKEVEEKRAQARSNLFWDIAMRVQKGDPESPDQAEEAYLQHCHGDDEMQCCEEQEAAVQAENEVSAEAVEEPPAAVGKASRKSKVGNQRKCPLCSRGKNGDGKEYNMSNFSDHMKVHRLEEGGDMGEQARHPCTSCKDARQCRVARRPQAIKTYACMCCLRAHRCCSFNIFKKGGNKCKDEAHPALLP